MVPLQREQEPSDLGVEVPIFTKTTPSAIAGVQGLFGAGRKPSSVRDTRRHPDSHLSRTTVASRLQQPTRGSSDRTLAVWVAPRRLFGLAPTGGYRAVAVASTAVGSYPTFSPLPPGLTPKWRSIFCGPIRRLSAPRRYLAVYPLELGLSSGRNNPPATIPPTPEPK